MVDAGDQSGGVRRAIARFRRSTQPRSPAPSRPSVSKSWGYTPAAEGEIRKGDEAARGISFFIPFGLMLLMFISVMSVAQPMLSSVIEEKQQRIAEVLLGSASPFQIMMGKLMGNVGVALTIVAVYLTGDLHRRSPLWLCRPDPDLALGLVHRLRRARMHDVWLDLHRGRRGLHRDQGNSGPAHAGDDRADPAADGLADDRARTAQRVQCMDLARAGGHADADAVANGRLADGPLVAASAGDRAGPGDSLRCRRRGRPRLPHRPLDARQVAENARAAELGRARLSRPRLPDGTLFTLMRSVGP